MPDEFSSGLTPEMLVERARLGCPDAFEQLVGHFEARIYNYIFRWTHNHEDALDLTQETFLKAYRALPRYKPHRSFASWLFTIAKNSTLNHVSRKRADQPLPEDLEVAGDDPRESLAHKEESSRLWARARQLKPRQFEALWLRYVEGFNLRETAAIMNLNAVHVRVLLFRGRKELARKLRADPASVSAKIDYLSQA